MRENQCAATGCTKQAHYVEAQLCKRHYMQVWKYGKLRPDLDNGFKAVTCLVEGCTASAVYRNLCRGHYRQVNEGEPLRELQRGTTCVIRGCTNQAVKKNLCPGHHYHYTSGKPFAPLRQQTNSVPPTCHECNRPVHAKGLCQKHYTLAWNSQRGKRIDGTPCLVCSETRGTQRCHITAARHGGTFTADNILPLCPTHHWCYDHDKLTEDELLAVIEAERKILGHSD